MRSTCTKHLEPAKQAGLSCDGSCAAGCVTQGDSYEEALTNARDAIAVFIQALNQTGQRVPQERAPIHAADGWWNFDCRRWRQREPIATGTRA